MVCVSKVTKRWPRGFLIPLNQNQWQINEALILFLSQYFQRYRGVEKSIAFHMYNTSKGFSHFLMPIFFNIYFYFIFIFIYFLFCLFFFFFSFFSFLFLFSFSAGDPGDRHMHPFFLFPFSLFSARSAGPRFFIFNRSEEMFGATIE